KTGDIQDSFTAKGLAEARERLRVDNLPDSERRAFFHELKRQMVEKDVMDSKYIDGKEDGLKEGRKEGEAKGRKEGLKEGEEKGRKEEKMDIARCLKGKVPIDIIVESTGLSYEEIAQL
ncbi:MAG: hypothetical protein IJ892_03000, partial [Prevotella sp.]|nr:hypothetical protein [Prevotella sp.]